MVDSPRRHISDPIKGDRWRYQTVYGHISTPVITQSQRLQQRKRRRVEEDPPTPARSFIEDYNKRKAATARFPPKITPQHIRAAMRKYEQVIEDACKGVEASCASCGEFIAKAGSELIPVDDDRLGSMKPPEDAILLDDCVRGSRSLFNYLLPIYEDKQAKERRGRNSRAAVSFMGHQGILPEDCRRVSSPLKTRLLSVSEVGSESPRRGSVRPYPDEVSRTRAYSLCRSRVAVPRG